MAWETDELGQSTLVPFQAFDFDAVDRNLNSPPEESDELTLEEIERSLRIFRRLVGWLWADGKNDNRGLMIRAAVICWVFQPELHALSMSDLARGFDLRKQSIGRWSDEFKLEFPEVKTAHMQNT